MKHNFNAGPAVLPKEVYLKLSQAVLDFDQSGISILELSHRSDSFLQLLTQTKTLARELLNIPANYHILFMQGGASRHFALIPQNLMHKHRKAIYIDTGRWSSKAINAAKKYGQVEVAASSAQAHYTHIPTPHFSQENITTSDYLHITSNNTVYGTRYTDFPKPPIPLIADMTSDIMTRKFNLSDFGCIYAGTQKNLGISGLGIVVLRQDLLCDQQTNTMIPEICSYRAFATQNSLVHTPPILAIYATNLMLKWIKAHGGIDQMEDQSIRKSKQLYDFIDQSELFYAPAAKADRSRTNIIFSLQNHADQAHFDSLCLERNIIYIKGHRSVGGYRASIYNATPPDSLEVLIGAMRELERRV